MALKPVGRPIATVPIHGPPRHPYGPPKPMPYPHPPSSSFGPPRPAGNIPPRRGFGPPFKPTGNGYYESQDSSSSFGSFSGSKPLGPIYEPIEVDAPYKFVPPTGINHKEIVVGSGSSGPQQHVHHHYHHENTKVSSATGLTHNSQGQLHTSTNGGVLESSGFNPFNSFSGSSHKDVTSASFGNFNNGLGAYASGVKPVVENYGTQLFDTGSYPGQYASSSSSSNSFGTSVGSYGNSSPFYKKELNLNRPLNNGLNGNSLQSAFTQSGYADKYKGFESIRSDNYDCVCVPYDQCPSQDILGRKEDFYLALDPRNVKSDIEALAEEVVITDGNGTMTVIRVSKELSADNKNATEENVNTEPKKVVKRETKEKDESKKEKSNIEPVSNFSMFY